MGNDVVFIEKKYASQQISKLSDVEVYTKTAEAIRRIHVITGWSLPNDLDYMKVLNEEFSLKLKEDFSSLNFDEIVFSFRKNGLGIKDWGKDMNLDLIAGVLNEYLSARIEASKQEEALNKPVQKTYTLEQLNNIHRGDVEAFYQRCLKGVIPPKELPPYYLKILIIDGMAHEGDDINEFFSFHLNRGSENIYIKE